MVVEGNGLTLTKCLRCVSKDYPTYCSLSVGTLPRTGRRTNLAESPGISRVESQSNEQAKVLRISMECSPKCQQGRNHRKKIRQSCCCFILLFRGLLLDNNCKRRRLGCVSSTGILFRFESCVRTCMCTCGLYV